MSYGVKIDNSSGVLQIDETHLNLGLVSSGTATCNVAVGGPSNLYYATVTKATGVTYPVIAIHTYGNAIALTGINISGGSASWNFVGGQNDEFIYYIFDKYPTSTSGYGLQVFDGTGNVTFNSDYPPMSVKAFGTTNTNNLSSGPVYAAILEAPNFSATVTETPPELEPTFYTYISRYQAVQTSSTGAETFSLIFEQYTQFLDPGDGTDVGPTRNIGVIDVTNMGTQPSGPSYAISPSTTSANEGTTVTFTVATSNVSNGTTLYWTTTGSVDANDFTDTTLSGSVTINNNTGSISRVLDNDSTTEGAENFALQLRTGSTSGTIVATSGSVTVNDTSTASITYSLSAPASINEGSSGTVNVTTAGLLDGTILYWKVEPTADFGTTTGSVTISSNAGSFSVTPTADSTTEGAETGTVRLYTNSARTNQVATDTFTINDTSTTPATYTLTAPTSINEGSAGTVNVSTANYGSGTLYWKVEPATDFSITQGTVTITSNAGSFSVTPTADSTTEGAETGTVRLYTNSARTNQVATDTFTINDTSVTPDYTPAVTGTWSNISDTTNGDGDTGNVTLSNINQTINLYWTNAGGDSDNITVQYSVNGGAFTTLAEGSSNTVAITNGQTLGWRVTTTQSTSQTGTITIKNASDGNATVGNTFTYTVAVTPSYAGNTFTLTVGQDDPKIPLTFGYSRSNFGSISPTTQFLDIYGTNTHQVDSLFKSSVTNSLTFAISGTTTVTNDTWTSITVPVSGGTTTLNRSAASYTNLGGTGGAWLWASFTSTLANGTVTLA